MATNYQRGRQFEYRARDKALKRGAVYVMRAASSKGAADLIVLWPPLIAVRLVEKDSGFSYEMNERVPQAWLVQCKRDGKLPKTERETLLDIAGQTGATPVLARVPKAGRGVEFINLTTMEEL